MGARRVSRNPGPNYFALRSASGSQSGGVDYLIQEAIVMQTDVHLKLDPALLEQAEACGPLDAVLEQALREALDPESLQRRRRWAEDNALLVEALAGGAAETAP